MSPMVAQAPVSSAPRARASGVRGPRAPPAGLPNPCPEQCDSDTLAIMPDPPLIGAHLDPIGIPPPFGLDDLFDECHGVVQVLEQPRGARLDSRLLRHRDASRGGIPPANASRS